MSKWTIGPWNPGDLPPEFAGLFVEKKPLMIKEEGESLTLAWQDSDTHPCSMTLSKDARDVVPAMLRREGHKDMFVSALVEIAEKDLTGNLQLPNHGTSPGTFAATLDPING